MAGDINLSFSAYQRSLFPEAVALNVLSEAAPTKPNAPLALIARPGLVAFATLPSAPIRGLFQRQGLLDDKALVVASTSVYTVDQFGTVTTLTGTVAGSGLVEIDGGLDADYNTVIRIATGSKLYKVFGGAVTEEAFPVVGGAGATSVAFWAGYWTATEAGSDAVYYQNPGSSTWSAIQFASAEYAPDKNLGQRIAGETNWLLGAATTEGWRLTGNASSPLEPSGGLKFDIGCRAIATAVNCAGALLWVTDTCSVVMTTGGEPRVISDNGLSEQIRGAEVADLSATWFIRDQHVCYVLNLGSATWVYDLTTQRWTRFSTQGSEAWTVRLCAVLGDKVIGADRAGAAIYELDPDARTDLGTPFPLQFCGFLDIPDGVVNLANIVLDCETGFTPVSGTGSDPIIGLRLSRDGGRTWGAVKYRPLGLTGEFTKQPRWNALGEARSPLGVICKWEASEPVGRRFSAARFNVSP